MKENSRHLIFELLRRGNESQSIFKELLKAFLNASGADDGAIILPSERNTNIKEVIVKSRTQIEDYELLSLINQQKEIIGSWHILPLLALGAEAGAVILKKQPKQKKTRLNSEIQELLWLTEIAAERKRLTTILQQFIERSENLSLLNQLAVNETSLKEIGALLVKRVSVRFNSKPTLLYSYDQENSKLVPLAGIGCTKERLPQELKINLPKDGITNNGRLISPQNLPEEISFLADLDANYWIACPLQYRQSLEGILFLGITDKTAIEGEEIDEFCRGAAAGLANIRAAEELKLYSSNLESLVEKRTAELNIAKKRADEANRAKSQFLANMSHELRSPLTAVIGLAEILSEGLMGDLNNDQKQALISINKSGAYLKRLIDDVLNLSKIESGKEKVEPTGNRAYEIVSHAMKILSQTALAKDITLLSPIFEEGSDDSSAFLADPKHASQIIINLLSNAIKYTPNGGKVAVRIYKNKEEIKISIEDNGVGISANQLSKLFNPFERGDNIYSLKQEGTGIGLNLTKRLVELNGGRIEVASEVGKGSTFSVYFKATNLAQENANSEANGALNYFGLSGKKAIVVEPNLDIQKSLKLALAQAGADVFAFSNAKEGLEFFNGLKKNFDVGNEVQLIISDLPFNKISALKFLRTVKRANKQLPLIVVSANAFDSDREKALRAGADLFFSKPFSIKEILNSASKLMT
ncbi:MAG TPA: ATP-binding protein [Oligoflexia bacterium]|nr:ATP-binding protein [Oligoflexia bacterium]HMP27764.1 ATP-binding protein [Oligoflexia bacterium]